VKGLANTKHCSNKSMLIVRDIDATQTKQINHSLRCIKQPTAIDGHSYLFQRMLLATNNLKLYKAQLRFAAITTNVLT